MNFEELEKLVIKKAPLPMSGRYEETVCFLALRGLYTSLAGKRITKEQAVKERVQLKKKFITCAGCMTATRPRWRSIRSFYAWREDTARRY